MKPAASFTSLFAALLLAAPAWAEWPSDRPIQVIVPGPPGGGMDLLARGVLRHVQPRLPGSSFVVLNRPGASGQIAFEAVAQAAPDGYTLGAAQTPALNALPIERQVRYRVADFTFIANVVDDPGGLFVRADSPLRGVEDLVALAAARPGIVTVGTAGIGTDDHLLLLALQDAAGVSYSHVPYAGTPPIVTALLSGDLDVGSFNMGEGLPMLRDGTLRALAQGGTGRWEETAEVPTFQEQGLDVLGGSTRGIVAPSGMPASIRARLSAAFADAMAEPAWLTEARRLSLPLRPMDGDAQRAHFLAEDAKLRALWQRRPWRD